MSLPIYQRVAVTDAGDIIPGAEYTVINENTGVAQPIYSDRNGTSLKSAPYFADSVGTIQFFIAQGTTFRVAASGGVGTYTDRYVYGVAEAVLVQADGNVSFADNQKVTFGAGSDLQIYHDGSNSYIDDAGTGDLRLRGSAVTRIQSYAGEDMVVAVTNGAVNLYHNNAKKLETTATGIDVTGEVLADSLEIFGAPATYDFSAGTDPLVNAAIISDNVNAGTGPALVLGSVYSASNTVANARIFAERQSTGSTNAGATDLIFEVGQASSSALVERVRIDSSGNLLVGTTNTNPVSNNIDSGVQFGDGRIRASKSDRTILELNRKASDGPIIGLYSNGITVGSIGLTGGYPYFAIPEGTAGIRLVGTTVKAMQPCNATGGLLDDIMDVGRSNARFNDAYIKNGVTTGSDQTQKQDILEITAAEYNVAKACKSLLRSFRWIDAVEKKGDDARIHFGIMAQDLQDAFTAEGLDAGRYAMFMSNTWWEAQTEVPAVEAVEGVEFVQAVEASEALYSEDGELISEAVEAVEGVEGVEAVEAKDAYTRTDTFETLAEAPAGATERTRLGVRYSELLAFIIAAL